MKATWTLAVLGILLAGPCTAIAAQTEKRPAPARPADRTADEKAIREAGAAFVRAYNAGDAKAVAALFTQDAEVVIEDGHLIAGREAIAAQFAATFEATPGETMEIEVDSIRFLGADVAKEEGRARVGPARAKPGGTAKTKNEGLAQGGGTQNSRYTVLYVREDGRWLQSSVREHADKEMTPHERLEPLAWLLGEWVDEGSASVVFSTTKWSEDGNFLLRDFTLQIEGKPAMRGTQLIGWDPLVKQITSWVFDSEGGHGVAHWSRDGNRWVVKASGVLRDGRTATATQVYTVVNPHLVRWKSVDRTVGGQVEPDLAEFVMVRKPPRPR